MNREEQFDIKDLPKVMDILRPVIDDRAMSLDDKMNLIEGVITKAVESQQAPLNNKRLEILCEPSYWKEHLEHESVSDLPKFIAGEIKDLQQAPIRLPSEEEIDKNYPDEGDYNNRERSYAAREAIKWAIDRIKEMNKT
jgi:hypothetical protein